MNLEDSRSKVKGYFECLSALGKLDIETIGDVLQLIMDYMSNKDLDDIERDQLITTIALTLFPKLEA